MIHDRQVQLLQIAYKILAKFGNILPFFLPFLCLMFLSINDDNEVEE
jgi:hypothetical protein